MGAAMTRRYSCDVSGVARAGYILTSKAWHIGLHCIILGWADYMGEIERQTRNIIFQGFLMIQNESQIEHFELKESVYMYL